MPAGNFAAMEEVLTSGIWKVIPALSALALAAMIAPAAHAGCGLYSPVPHAASWQPQIASPRLVLAAFDDEGWPRTDPQSWEPGRSIGSPKAVPGSIPDGTEVDAGYASWHSDGTEVDAGYASWHSDGTEINVSGLRPPITGDVCLGVWIKTGARTYQLNHFGISYDPTGAVLVGPARIQQWLILDPKGDATSGKFTIDQYDEAGNLLAHVQGKVIGTRVTMDTGFESVE